MSYDKKSSTINIETDNPKDLERDIFAHMAHVTEQIDRDLASGKLKPGVNPSVSSRTQYTENGNRMRWIAALLNVGLLCVVLYLLFTKGAPGSDDLLFAGFLIATPIFSLFALAVQPGESLFALYLKRKALEERQRIKKLEGH